MKKILFFLIFCVLIVFTTCSEDNNTKKKLNGNWYKNDSPVHLVKKEYGWGIGKTVKNFTLEIDLYKEPAQIRLPVVGGPFEIKSINEINKETYDLTFEFDRGNFNVTYRIHIIENNMIWLELKTDKNLTFLPTGSDFIYYRIDG